MSEERLFMKDRDLEQEYKDELREAKQLFDIEAGVKDIVEKFGITEKQAFFCWFVALGRTPLQASRMCYSYGDDRNARTQAGKLMNMWKIKEVLAHLNNDQVVESTLQGLRMWWINWGRDKLSLKEYHHTAAVGIWKSLGALIFEDKLPDEGKSMAKNLEKLGEAFAISEAAKKRGMEAYKKPVEKKEEADAEETDSTSH